MNDRVFFRPSKRQRAIETAKEFLLVLSAVLILFYCAGYWLER